MLTTTRRAAAKKPAAQGNEPPEGRGSHAAVAGATPQAADFPEAADLPGARAVEVVAVPGLRKVEPTASCNGDGLL